MNSKFDFNYGVVLGNFDGLHLGHQKLLEEFKVECQKRNIVPVVITFLPHPRIVLQNSKNFLLTSYAKRNLFLQIAGLNHVLEINFNRDFSSLDPADFLSKYVITSNLKFICVGHDFKFGANKGGTYEIIKNTCQKNNIESAQKGPYEINGVIPSSSIIRNYLYEGNIKDANKYLGRNFSLEGIVVKGNQRGTKIGIPTANFVRPDFMLTPKTGVYITETKIEDLNFQSVTNIGINPTFLNQNIIHIETHILGFNRNIYGELIKVTLHERLRNEQKFASVNELVEQIKKDIENAKKYFK